jgi:SPP1 gp7 family putative phage head morphogenesis protein
MHSRFAASPIRRLAVSFFIAMTLLSFLTSKFLGTEAGKAAVQKSALSWVNAWLRGDDTGGGYQPNLSQPFKNSVWVQRAIKRVAEPITAVDLDFYELDANGDEREIEDPALTAFWEMPGIDRSGLMDRSDFIEATVGWLKLAGESFWLLDDTWLTQRLVNAAPRAPILIARPDRMEAVVENNRLTGWIFTDAKGDRHPLVKEQVVHRKFWNPYDDIRGLGEYAAARIASEADYLAGTFALAINKANGDRGVIAVAKGAVPTDEQQEQITRALREKMMAARRGDFRPIFLSGDVEIEDPKVNAPDANFVAARLENRHEIFIAFGVPPSMADVVASYSVGSASDRYLLLTETCMPLANGKLSGAIEAASRMFTSSTIRARFDFDEHPIMQQVRAERLKSLDSLWDKGMPVKEANDYLGLGLPEFPGWEIGYLPFNVGPASQAGLAPVPGETQQTGNSTTDNTDNTDQTGVATDLSRLFSERNDPVAALECAFHSRNSSSSSSSKERDPQRIALANAHLAKRKPIIKAFHSKFTAQLMKARKETLSRIHARTKSVVQKDSSSDFLFSLENFKRAVIAAMRIVATSALDIAGQQFFEEIGLDNPFTMPNELALHFLLQRENRMASASDEIFEKIKNTLAEGIRDGDTMQQLADRVKTEFNAIDKEDAMRIASTETGAAYGTARQEAMRQAGVTNKQWLTSGLPNVRPAHRAAEGETVPVNEPFVVGGENLMYPGDSSGSPWNVINCHCVSIAVASKSSSSS